MTHTISHHLPTIINKKSSAGTSKMQDSQFTKAKGTEMTAKFKIFHSILT